MPGSFQIMKIWSRFFSNKYLGYSEITSTHKWKVNHSPKQAAALLAFCKPNNEQRVTKLYSAKKGLCVRVKAQDKA